MELTFRLVSTFLGPLKGQVNNYCFDFNKTKDLPKSAVIDLYRKYYLDFIVFGFSAESVEEVINGAMGPEFENRKENLKRAKDSLVSKAKEISEKSPSEFENCY